MGSNAPLSDGLLPASDTLQDGHALLHELIGLNVNQVGAWQPVLGNEDRLLVPLDIREELSRLALESGDKFGTHKVTLQYHFWRRKGARGKGLTPE